MPLTYDTIKVGMHVKCNYPNMTTSGGLRYEQAATVQNITEFGVVVVSWLDGLTSATRWTSPCYFDEITSGRKRKSKPRKVIPDIPLDPTLPILQAGYLQDRLRKKFK